MLRFSLKWPVTLIPMSYGDSKICHLSPCKLVNSCHGVGCTLKQPEPRHVLHVTTAMPGVNSRDVRDM